MADSRHSGRRYRDNRKLVLATSTICWLCGHPGADSVDHVHPDRGEGVDNLKPAHQRHCPTCGVSCNRSKGDRPPVNVNSRDW